MKLFDGGIFGGLMVYALFSSISIAGANIGIAIASLFALIRCVKQPVKVSVDKGLFISISIFLCTMLIAAIMAPSPEKGLLRLGTFIYRMFPLFLLITFIKDKRQVMSLVAVMSISILVADSYAIWQGLQGDGRARAFSSHPMIFAGYAIQIIPFFFFIREVEIKTKFLYTVLVILTMIALVFNGTRGAWIAIIITFLSYLIMHIRRNQKTVLICSLLFCLFGFIFWQIPFLNSRAMSISDMSYQSNSERMLIWKSAQQMFFDHPIVGVGLGHFENFYLTSYISPLAKEQVGHAHNNFLHMLAETGFIGFTGFVVMFAYILYHNYLKYSRAGDIWNGALFFVTLALLLQGLTEFNFGDSAVIRMYWFMVGLVYCSANKL